MSLARVRSLRYSSARGRPALRAAASMPAGATVSVTRRCGRSAASGASGATPKAVTAKPASATTTDGGRALRGWRGRSRRVGACVRRTLQVASRSSSSTAVSRARAAVESMRLPAGGAARVDCRGTGRPLESRRLRARACRSAIGSGRVAAQYTERRSHRAEIPASSSCRPMSVAAARRPPPTSPCTDRVREAHGGLAARLRRTAARGRLAGASWRARKQPASRCASSSASTRPRPTSTSATPWC